MGKRALDKLEVDPNDIVAFGVAAEKLEADRGLVHQPELKFFKDFLLSWGGKLPPAKAAKEDSGKAPADEVLGIESDGEEAAEDGLSFSEMEFPAGELEAELADEDGGINLDSDEEDEADAERLPKDAGPYPLLPPGKSAEPSDARKKVLAKVKQEALQALAGGNIRKAVDRYTEVVRTGGATGHLLAMRAALLLKQRRPCAAIRDCCAALKLNPDCGKAFHVRGVAHRQLGHWKKAYRDLSQGQRLDFSEDSVNVHMFVGKKVGATKKKPTRTEGSAKRAVELLFVADDDGPSSPSKKKKQEPAKVYDLRAGQAVRLAGLVKAPQLNGLRGIVQRINPKDSSRWEVEVRMERGQVEIKSLKGENILVVRSADAESWKADEAKHAQERRQRAYEEKKWQEEEEARKRMDEKRRATERAMFLNGFPDMDPSEKLEAEMSALPIGEDIMSRLRRLSPQEALDILKQGNIAGPGNIATFIKIKVKQKLGEPEEEEPTPAQASTEVLSDDSDDDEDFDMLPEEQEPTLSRGVFEAEPSEALTEKLGGLRREAAEFFEDGDFESALAKCTEAVAGGGASSLMLTKRGECLLKLRRPCAAIEDCSAALEQNPDLGKAYRIRGIAHRKLGHWQKAHQDLTKAQQVDYDEGIAAVVKFIAAKVRKDAAKRARPPTD